jgi:NAD(P)-dependent dehydrogenase (short-subunit alcohol dehydrogenase family)
VTDPEALVVVGAGPGLGSAMAQRFAQGGWSIGLIARRQDALDAAEADLRSYGVPVRGARGDATNALSLDGAFRAISDTLGMPRAVVYNASLYQTEPALELSTDALMLAFGVHVVGALNAARSAIALMRPLGRGVLIFTINCLALHPQAVSAAMSIGKGAQLNLALSLERELADSGIKVAIVTITAPIKPGTAFDPSRIAELYWRIVHQHPGQFTRDHIFDGAGAVPA